MPIPSSSASPLLRVGAALALAATWPLARDPGRLTLTNQDVYGSTWLFAWAVRQATTAPLEILEYVVVHELCHLREPNHQKPFWRLLGAARPGWQEQAGWLREHGQELHDYAPGRAVVPRSAPTRGRGASSGRVNHKARTRRVPSGP